MVAGGRERQAAPMDEGGVTPAVAATAAARPEAGREVVQQDLRYIADEVGFEPMAGKRLLITGGAGFLGYYLVQAPLLWNQGVSRDRRIDVTVCDNYIRSTPAWLMEHAADDSLHVLKHDITKSVPDAAANYDYIIHAASIASPIYYRQHPIETMDANIYGLRHLLDHSLQQRDRAHPISGFLFFSSSEIYGDAAPDRIPTSEDYWGNVSCTGPRACYDESKRFGETMSVNFARQHGLPITVARPFNNYGPGLRLSDQRVLPDFARDVLAGRDIVLLSDGGATRTFCYVADAIAGYYKVLLRGRAGEAYNIGTESPEISMRQLATKVAELSRQLFDYRGAVVLGTSADQDYLTHNPSRRCPSIVKARAELQFAPKVGLEDGLRRLLTWYATHEHAN